MVTRVDKCSTFGIRKALNKFVQYLPELIINSSLIPAFEIGKSFCYLGRYFDFEMTNNEHKIGISRSHNQFNERNRSQAITS